MVLGGECQFLRCRFIGNTAIGGGGGFYAAGNAVVTVKECEFLNNRADLGPGGGASLQVNSFGRFERCSFAGNSASTTGGALTLYQSRAEIVNCVLWGNGAVEGGGAVHQLEGSNVVAVNSLFWRNSETQVYFTGSNNSLAVGFCDVEFGERSIATNRAGSYNWLDGNIDEEPMLNAPGENDFTLQAGSPLINAGTADFEYGGRRILRLNENEYYGEAPDIGRFEVFEEERSVAGKILPERCSLLTLYPNPFNGQTLLQLAAIPAGARIRLEVWSIDGRRLGLVFDGLTDGRARPIIWGGSGLPAGEYLLTIRGGVHTEAIKATLLK